MKSAELQEPAQTGHGGKRPSHRDYGGVQETGVKGLRCAGDVFSVPSDLTIRPPQRTIASHTKNVSFTGQVFPQPPSYLFLVYQKDPSYTTYDNPFLHMNKIAPPGANYTAKYDYIAARAALTGAAALNLQTTTKIGADGSVFNQEGAFNTEIASRNIAMAQDSNACIVRFSCVVQSAVGAFAFRDSEAPYLQDRDRLWRAHVSNFPSQYAENGRGQFFDRECCLLLSSSDYLIGLETSSGTVFPITVDIECEFANRAVYSGGECFTTGCGVKGKMAFEDLIIGEPVLVGCFNQNVMSIASSSSVLSSQAFSQATTAAALQSS